MVIDDHGADFAGEYQKVNAPIIVYDTNKLLDKIGSKPVSDLDAKKALDTYSKDIAEIPGSFAENNYVPNVLKRRYGLDNYYNNKSYDYLY